MKKDSRERMFEVMGRLDKTFKPRLNEGSDEITKPKLNEGFEEIEATDNEEIPAEMGTGEEMAGEEQEEKSPDEILAELTAKVDEIYALIHGGSDSEEIAAEIPTGEPEEISIETGEIEPENLQEWNFDKKKGEKEEEKEEETPAEEKEENKEEIDEADEAKPKIPVAAVAKVGK